MECELYRRIDFYQFYSLFVSSGSSAVPSNMISNKYSLDGWMENPEA